MQRILFCGETAAATQAKELFSLRFSHDLIAASDSFHPQQQLQLHNSLRSENISFEARCWNNKTKPN